MAYRCGLNHYQIAEKVGIDVRQVRYPLDNEAPTPKKKVWRSSLRCRAKAAISRICLQFQEDALDDIATVRDKDMNMIYICKNDEERKLRKANI
jgi:hypothetical protein